jgi:hypothetical protein
MIAKSFPVVIALILANSSAALAADPRTEYYTGEAKFSTPDGTLRSTDTMLIQKAFDPHASKIVEKFMKVTSAGDTTTGTITLNVSGQKFHMADDANTSDGDGEFFGEPWKWTYLKGSMKFKNGMKCDLENFLSDPHFLVARKTIYQADGSVLGILDESLHAITPETFTNLWGALSHAKTSKEL